MKKRLISILLCGLLAAACIGCREKTYSISYNYAECKVEDGETCVARECFNVVNKDAESLKIYQPYTNDKNVYFEIEIDK